METRIVYHELIERKNRLASAKDILKQKFIGLDDIIDEVLQLMTPWFLFPEAQLRPTIISLWGLTGTGKTALVQAIVEHLTWHSLYARLDMGEFDSEDAAWMKNVITDELEYFDNKAPIICLDEFQFARTLNGARQERGNEKVRVIWDLLDSGKIEYVSSGNAYILFRADNCLKRLACLKVQGVVIADGIVVAGEEEFKRAFEGFYFNYEDRKGFVFDASYFVSESFVTAVVNLFDHEQWSRITVQSVLKGAGLNDIISLLKSALRSRPASKVMNLSGALIFIVGNLDEAYEMCNDLNPDISADEFYKATSKISIADIKGALATRFRPEQIARLGNNHVLYHSFKNEHYTMLIQREIKRIGDEVFPKFGVEMEFDSSIVRIVYAEGVFPVQGTRPVFTTIRNLIESRISNLMVTILESGLSVAKVIWHYKRAKFSYTLIDKEGNVLKIISDDARLKLENMRQSMDPEIQASVAVHEAAHAIVASLTLRIVPSVVLSRTASSAEGFCYVLFPKGPMTKQTLRKDIMITLAGYVAEKMIFGDDLTTSGVYDDLRYASALANKAVRKYGMGDDPVHIAVQASAAEHAFRLEKSQSEEAVKLIRDGEAATMELLDRNKLLLLKMAEYLTANSRMEQKMIEAYVKQYSVESWVQTDGFIAEDDYYKFNTTLTAMLEALQPTSVDREIEKLMSDISIV